MGRFTTSKYKNAAPKKLKREHIASGLRINELCQNDPIACGVDKVVFAGEGAGIGVLDVGELGNVQPRVLHGHGQFVRSFEFNPFHKDCLCTCAGDGLIKLWDTSSLTCSTTLHASEHTYMTRFHPVADSIIAAAEHTQLRCYDVSQEKRVSSDDIACTTVSWSYDGRLLCAAGKSGEITISDMRAKKTIGTATLFDANKDIHHEWLGVDKLVLAGFKSRERVFQTVDISDLSRVISTLSYGSGSGQPFVKFDYDTRMLYLYAKGDHAYTYCEVGQGGVMKENWREACSEAVKGIALAPKISLDVMSGEVNRLMILHHTSLCPTPYTVPRKSYHEFHDDLFPETRGPVPGVDGDSWLHGNDGYRELVSLNPADRKSKKEEEASNGQTKQEQEVPAAPVVEVNVKHKQILSHLTEGHSIYRNIDGVLSHKKFHFHGLNNVQTVFSQESNGFQVGKHYGAHLMTGTGGRIGIIDLHSPGENNTPQLELVNNGNPIGFQWDPFSKESILAVGSDSSLVKLWQIEDMETAPTLLETFEEHRAKVIIVCYHPGVAGLLATCDVNGTVVLWDTHNMTKIRCVLEERGASVAMCWDTIQGHVLYLALKTGEVVAFDTRSDTQTSVQLGSEIRSGRICATKDLVVVSALGHGNTRTLLLFSLYQDSSFSLLSSTDLGNGTALYTPFIDVDRNLGYLAARGEESILPYEFRVDGPLPLAQFSCAPVQYGCSQLDKQTCDAMAVETARFYKLCKDAVHLVTFSVPRLRKEYFQDDIYPHMLDLSSPVLTVAEWLAGKEYAIKTIDLCPSGVKRNSQVEVIKSGSQQSKVQREHLKNKATEHSRDEIFNAFAQQVQEDAGPLEQDMMEGCDEDEWSD